MVETRTGVSPGTITFVAFMAAIAAVSGVNEANYHVEAWVKALPVKGMSTASQKESRTQFDQIYAVEMRRKIGDSLNGAVGNLVIDAFTHAGQSKAAQSEPVSQQPDIATQEVIQTPQPTPGELAAAANLERERQARHRLEAAAQEITLAGVTNNGAFLNGSFVELGGYIPGAYYTNEFNEAIDLRLARVRGERLWVSDGRVLVEISL